MMSIALSGSPCAAGPGNPTGHHRRPRHRRQVESRSIPALLDEDSWEKQGPGRPRIDAEIRRLIRTMARDGWDAPRIHGELLNLGFDVSEVKVSRDIPRRPVDPDKLKRWVAFLRNLKDAIAAMDFFTVQTASMRMLYALFVIEHGRRRIVHFNVTPNPTSAWVIQQLRESFPYDRAPRHLIFDRDTIFSPAVVRFVKAMCAQPARTAYRCPWQNPAAERWSAAAGASCLIMLSSSGSAISSD